MDISIDINKKSKNYRKKYNFILDEKDKNFLMIPENYAHGFQTLKNNTILLYLHTKEHNIKNEKRINPIYNQILKNFKWPIRITSISKMDKQK